MSGAAPDPLAVAALAKCPPDCPANLYYSFHGGTPMTLPLTDHELVAIEIAWDELTSYLDAVGDEAQLDDEGMPTDKLTDTIETLRNLLERHGRVVT